MRVIEVEDLHCGYNATELILQTILLGTSIVMHCIPIMCQFLEKERKKILKNLEDHEVKTALQKLKAVGFLM